MYTIITRDNCSFCDMAKTMLRDSNVAYTEYNVQSGSSQWVLTLIKQAKHTTVPQIFASDGSHIGGYAELKKFIGTFAEGAL
jgi:glutaredoxin 3